TPMIKLRIGSLFLLLWTLLPGRADAGGELEVRWWSPDLSSTVTAEGVAFEPALVLPTSLDLGLEAEEEIEGRLLLRSSWGLFLRAAYQNVSSGGSTDLNIGVVDLPFSVNALISTDLDFEYGRLALGWMFGPENGPLQVGVFAEAKGVRGDATITASALGLSAGISEDFEAGVPAAGAMLRAQVAPRVEIFAEASVNVESDEADVTDYELGARFLLSDNFAVGAGYRSLEIEGTFDSIDVDYSLEGVFVTASIRW
ncbi:MAG: hypothetical protein AAFY88_16215, partial [Acidobacteriota bacterium]